MKPWRSSRYRAGYNVPWPSCSTLSDHCSMRSVMPQPCIGSSCRALSTSMSSVPCNRSLRSLVTRLLSIDERRIVNHPFDCQGEGRRAGGAGAPTRALELRPKTCHEKHKHGGHGVTEGTERLRPAGWPDEVGPTYGRSHSVEMNRLEGCAT